MPPKAAGQLGLVTARKHHFQTWWIPGWSSIDLLVSVCHHHVFLCVPGVEDRMTNALPEKGELWNHPDTDTRAALSESYRHEDLGVVLETLRIGVKKVPKRSKWTEEAWIEFMVSRELQFWRGPESQGCASVRRMHVIVFTVVASWEGGCSRGVSSGTTGWKWEQVHPSKACLPSPSTSPPLPLKHSLHWCDLQQTQEAGEWALKAGSSEEWLRFKPLTDVDRDWKVLRYWGSAVGSGQGGFLEGTAGSLWGSDRWGSERSKKRYWKERAEKPEKSISQATTFIVLLRRQPSAP